MPDNTPEDIERQMKETRSSLSNKLETLEEKVADTVAKATEAVSSTVSKAKETVDNTVEAVTETVANVRDTFDIPEQVRRHPWLCFAASIAAGYVLEKMCDSLIFPSADHGGNGNGKHKQQRARGETPKPMPRWMAESQKAPEPSPYYEAESEGAKATGPTLMSTVGEHMTKLKDIAVGALFNVLRGVTVKSLGPTFAEPAGQFVDDVARSFGVKTTKTYASHTGV
jgi:ElaB/YqjD/DUF883 family membrane-anchored ribosome-binding protein